MIIRNALIHDAIHREPFAGDIVVENGKIASLGGSAADNGGVAYVRTVAFPASCGAPLRLLPEDPCDLFALRKGNPVDQAPDLPADFHIGVDVGLAAVPAHHGQG